MMEQHAETLCPTDSTMDRNSCYGEESQVQRNALTEQAIAQFAWGISSGFDVYDCDPATIRDAGKIRQFVVELCDLIQMKRFRDTMVVHFGEDERVAGFSMVQLIETSLISAHFANQTNTTYLDVFSCKPYDPDAVALFAKTFFGGSRVVSHVNLRGVVDG